MSPLPLPRNALGMRADAKPAKTGDLIIEAWAQGYLVGSLIIMGFITMANMRRGVLLHKLILLELVLGLWQGFWLFFDKPIYSWWLSVGAIFLNISWSLHNVISWMKIKPFLSKPVSWIFIGTVILVQPYWVVEIYANFAFFHDINDLFKKTRPWEALCRDPWWIFTTVKLFWTIKTDYDLTLREIVKISPRFGIMMLAMIMSIAFIILDICSVTGAFSSTLTLGINPFWKLAFVFKCLTDSLVLDDFKTALDRLRAFKISRIGSFSQDTSDRRTWNDGSLVNTWEGVAAQARRPRPEPLPSPDGDLVHTSSHFPGFHVHAHRNSGNKSQDLLREHQEAVEPDYTPRDFSNETLDPRSGVPSALEDAPFRTMESAHFRQAKNSYSMDSGLWDSIELQEDDYAQAMKEVQGQGHSSAVDPPKAKEP